MLGGTISLGLAVQVAGCGMVAYRSRFMVTIEVEVDGAIVSGSSVIEVVIRRNVEPPTTFHVLGVTPIVNLGRYGSLVSHLNTGAGSSEDINALSLRELVIYGLKPNGWSDKEPAKSSDYSYLDLARGPHELLPKHFHPMLRWLPADSDDIARSKFVERTALATTIGGNVRYLKSIVTPTNAQLITRLAQVQMPNPPLWLAKRSNRPPVDSRALENANDAL